MVEVRSPDLLGAITGEFGSEVLGDEPENVGVMGIGCGELAAKERKERKERQDRRMNRVRT